MRIDCGKIRPAQKVLTAIKKIVAKIPNKKTRTGLAQNYLALSCYQNCREQGFMVSNWRTGGRGEHRWVAFSENRNSDSIVVYPSQKDEGMPFTSITDESWQARRFFGPDEAEKAAAFCVKHLLG